MKTLFYLPFLMILPLAVQAQSLNEFQWKSRVIVLFTPAADDPLFQEQRALLMRATDELRERQVVLLTVTPGGDQENTGIFLKESASDYFYDQFSASPQQMELSLVGLDGEEKYRAKNEVTPVSVIFELIDSMPMRQRKLRQGSGNESSINAKDPTPRIPDGRGH